MNEDVLFVAICTQKGGTGKTTLTTLIASYLQYEKNINVAVVDCDDQLSFLRLRERDMKNIKEDSYYNRIAQRFFSQSESMIYPVIESIPDQAIQRAQELYNNLPIKPKIIFFDLPGTLANTGIIKSISLMDYIFCPISADMLTINSGLSFATTINNGVIGQNRGILKGLYMVWNKVDGREKTDLYKVYDKTMENLGLPTLKTELPYLVRFKHEMSPQHRPVFLSTVLPPDKSLLKESMVEELVAEVLRIINLD